MDGDGEITPEEAAIQIASRVDGHEDLSTDQRDNNGDGAFVNIEEDDEDGQSADVVIKDTDGNHVDLTLIKLKFTDSDENRFEQRTQIDNTTLVEKYNSDGDPLGTDSIDVDNRVLRVGSDDGDADVIPEESDSLDIATPKQADWMDDDNDGVEGFGNSLRSRSIEQRLIMRTLGDESKRTIDLFFINRFPDLDVLGQSSAESIGVNPNPDADGITNFSFVSERPIIDLNGSFTTAHEIGHVLKDDGSHKDSHYLLMASGFTADQVDTVKIDIKKRLLAEEWRKIISESGPTATNPGSDIQLLKRLSN